MQSNAMPLQRKQNRSSLEVAVGRSPPTSPLAKSLRHQLHNRHAFARKSQKHSYFAGMHQHHLTKPSLVQHQQQPFL